MNALIKSLFRGKEKFSGALLAAGALLLFFIGSAVWFAHASSPFDIEFPVPELENCANKDECKAYCDDRAHKEACVAFGRKHGLIDEGRAEVAKKLPPKGPGGCASDRECRNYCEEPDHAEECLQFAEDHGLIEKSEIKRAREFVGQTGPGGCRGAGECRAYCDDASHKKECLEFAKRKGLISEQQIKVAERVLDEGGPGGCRGEDECRAYCEDPGHLNECVQFGEEQGFISKEEAARVKKTFGRGPGGCQGKNACETYCREPGHQEECINFAEENGFMSKEEVARARKFIGKSGPGGCRGPEQCRQFCENPANADGCLEHAEREGLMPKEEIERARKFAKAAQAGGPGGCQGHQQCGQYCSVPEHQEECFEFAKKNGMVRPDEERDFKVGRKLNQKLEESGGPGGCRSEGECRAYCADPAHVEECVAFATAHGGVPVEQARQMLKQFTEDKFINRGPQEFRPPDEFHRFEEEGRRRFEEFRQLEEQFRGDSFPGFGPPGDPGEFPGGPGGFPGGPGEFRPGGPGGMGEPGRFGGGPGEGRFPGGFVGPGGCASPVECIKYCSEHKDECFGKMDPFVDGPIGGPLREDRERRGKGPEEGFGMPRLRSNLVQEFKEGELPEDFHQKPFEERQRFFMEKFGPPPGMGGGGQHGNEDPFGRCLSEAITSGSSQDDARKKCEESFRGRGQEGGPREERGGMFFEGRDGGPGRPFPPEGEHMGDRLKQLPEEFRNRVDQFRGGHMDDRKEGGGVPFRPEGFRPPMGGGSGDFRFEGRDLPGIPGAFEPRPGGEPRGEFRGIPGQFSPQGMQQGFEGRREFSPPPGGGSQFSPPPGGPGSFGGQQPPAGESFGGHQPPQGGTPLSPSPSGGTPPPSGGSVAPPPSGSQPPPSQPSGYRHLRDFFASVLNLIPLGE